MKVKVGDAIFDSNIEPILLVLEEEDKKNIVDMDPKANIYVSYPAEMDVEKVKEWMKEAPPQDGDPQTDPGNGDGE